MSVLEATLDLAQVRLDTAALARCTFLDSAGSSLMPASVVEAQHAHLTLEAELGGYAAEERVADRLEAVYGSVASLLSASPREIALTDGATAAWQKAFTALRLAAGDRILTFEAEYAANYVAYLQLARRVGVQVDVIPSDADGQVDLGALERAIDSRVKLVALTWVPSNGGLINPAAAVGRIARAASIPYLLDACQAVGQMQVDVRELGCDFLSATGRKFLRGPRGSGFLYVRESWLAHLEPHVLDHFGAPWVARDHYRLRDDARRFETWESSRVARLGLGAAIDYALAVGMPAIQQRTVALAARLREGLSSLAGVVVRDLGRARSGIVSFTCEGAPAHELVRRAARAGIVLGVTVPAITRLDAEARALPPMLRASPHYFNSEAEIDRLVEFAAAR